MFYYEIAHNCRSIRIGYGIDKAFIQVDGQGIDSIHTARGRQKRQIAVELTRLTTYPSHPWRPGMAHYGSPCDIGRLTWHRLRPCLKTPSFSYGKIAVHTFLFIDFAHSVTQQIDAIIETHSDYIRIQQCL